MVKEQQDVIIVGAGAAGLMLAARLAEGGQSVTILEAGAERQLGDLISSQIWARKLKWSEPAVSESGDHKIEHAFNAGSGTGGSAIHHYGVWLRMHEGDFSLKKDHGVGLDWPLNYADLAPHYDRVQAEVGLSGDASQERWRPPGAPYPMPPLPLFAQSKVLAKGFAKTSRHTSPLPLAINSEPYQGRRSCQYDGWCDAGCPIGALGNPLVTWLPRALASGVHIEHNARVSRVIRSAANPSRIESVEYLQRGARKTLSAERIIIAAFTVQSVRILLSSATAQHSAPGNHSDKLGRYLMTHPAATVFGIFEEETYPHQGVSAGQLLSHDEYDDKASSGGFGSSQWMIGHAIKPHDLLGYGTGRPDISGSDLEPWLNLAARHLGNMTLVCEDIALPENRITLSDKVDSEGISYAHTHHDLAPTAAARWTQRMAEGEEIMRSAGAQEVWSGPRIGMHIMGGAVMGDDPAQSVTDQNGRVHETDNLYVAGPALFPSSGA
ncbi:MAG: GMC family oxidoreductase, partial [Pseudomonadota bacterium]|nr:GMC family oxidoreductase [Pseudomonadota bacterium]